MGSIERLERRTKGVRRRWDRRSVLGAPRSIVAHAAKGNMSGLSACCTRWRVPVLTGGTAWTVENSVAV